MQYIFKFISCHWSLSVLPEHIRKPQNVHHTVPKNSTSLPVVLEAKYLKFSLFFVAYILVAH